MGIVGEKVTLARVGRGEFRLTDNWFLLGCLAMGTCPVVDDVDTAVKVGIGREFHSGQLVGEQVETAVIGRAKARISRRGFLRVFQTYDTKPIARRKITFGIF